GWWHPTGTRPNFTPRPTKVKPMTNLQFPSQFNMARYFLDDRVEEGRGDGIALITDEGRFSYRAVQSMANQVANALKARGIGPEDRVLIALRDRAEFVASFFGILKLGAVVTMVNPDLPEGDYGYYLGYTRARALIAERDVAERIREPIEAASLLRAVITV